jgi:predicted enzyme related to lactoylglutathione lyase
MGDRTSYPPGTFSWAELVTTDADSAKAFYTALLGWDYDDQPVGGDQVYSMATRDGKHVAALYTDGSQPPHWNCYVTVASVDEATAKAKDAGGTELHEPFDVMDVGRMAFVADPAGTAIFLWEPRQHIGAQLVNAPGALTWADLITPDPDGAARFYGELFGWTFEELSDVEGYRVIKNGDRENGGVFLREDAAPGWIPYFGHEDVARAIADIPGRGGDVLEGPVKMWDGAIGVFSDPQGAPFALWTGHYDD